MKQKDLFAERTYDHRGGGKVVLRIFVPVLHGGDYPGKDVPHPFEDVFDGDLCEVSPWICYFTIEGLPPEFLNMFRFGTDSLEALTNAITAASFILQEHVDDLEWFGESFLGIGEMIPDHYGPELVAQVYALIDKASES